MKELEAGGFRYIGYGIWECIKCGHLLKSNDILENDIDVCPKCNPDYRIGEVVEGIIKNDNADTDEYIELQRNRIKSLKEQEISNEVKEQ